MGVNTERFIRKPLYVDAVRVTSQNFEGIAAWCDGEIQKETEGPRTGKSYIRVRVQYPKSPRQSKAFIGDWVLYTDTGFKVYTNPAFRKSFDEAPVEAVKEERPATADEIREKLPHAQDRRPTAPPQDEKKTHEPPLPEPPVIEPGVDLGATPQGEQIEVVEATPQAIADAVNEQQPPVDSPEESTPLVQDHTPVQALPAEEAARLEERHAAMQGESPVEPVSEQELAGGPVSAPEPVSEQVPKPGDDQDHWDSPNPPQRDPVSEQAPEDAAAGKRILSEEEQAQMGPDAVREMVRTGDVILVQDLAA